jgi:hypothetical protein
MNDLPAKITKVVLTIAALAIFAAAALSDEGPGTFAFNGSPIDPDGVVLIDSAGRCSGSMLTPNTFLTAAHCVPFIGQTVFVGVERINSFGTVIGGQEIAVTEALIPTEYKGVISGNWEWDLAVVGLAEPYAGTIKAFPPTAPEMPWSDGWAGAWGDTGIGLSREPLGAKYDRWEQVQPSTFQPPSRRFVGWGVLQGFGIEGSETCGGDSGSGLVVAGNVIGHVVAGFPPCGEHLDLPGYFIDYTNEQYRNWIGLATSELDPWSFNPNFGSCSISSRALDGLRHVDFTDCIDGSRTTVREDGVVVTFRDRYYGAFFLQISVPAAGACVFFDVDGFGEIIERGDC